MPFSKEKNVDRIKMNSVDTHKEAPLVTVAIEIPRGSFVKRGSAGKVDFVSPVPCPFNYGSVPAFKGQDGDLLDAVVLGPRLPAGTKVTVRAWGAVRMIDRGMYDDKLICGPSPVSAWKRRLILLFFLIYAKAKALINMSRGHRGRNSCEGWREAESALGKATPRTPVDGKGSMPPF
jgi:inorganic pyrophosphatase